MSASLVGSEMCIRDRPGGPRDVRCSGRPLVWAPSHTSPRGHQPVSYTHLTLPTMCRSRWSPYH
eukprot:11018994-Alexandrium_andersonii.AAC.1